MSQQRNTPKDETIDDNWGLPTDGVPVTRSKDRTPTPDIVRADSENVTIPRKGDKAPDIEVDIVDDRPAKDQKRPPRDPKVPPYDVTDEELKQYGDDVQTRIKKLRYEYHEERRAKEAADRERQEAIRVAQTYQQEAARLKQEQLQWQQIVLARNQAVAEQQKLRYDAEIAQARQQIALAQEAGDSVKVAQAQEVMSRAAAQAALVGNYLAAQPQQQQQQQQWQQAQQQQQWQQAQQPPQQQQQQGPDIDPRAVKWLKSNKWFGDDKAMTGYAYGIHEELVRDKHVDPRSDQYYEEVDKAMRQRFPDKFDEDDDDDTPPPRPQIVAAPTRGNAPKKVQLTQTQAALAKRLGLTLEQYATQLLKEQKNG